MKLKLILNVDSTLNQRWGINLCFQRKYGWSSTLIQRWINVDDQPFSNEILRWSVNVDSTLNQRWWSTFFSWIIRLICQRWYNVESTLMINHIFLENYGWLLNVDSTLNQRWHDWGSAYYFFMLVDPIRVYFLLETLFWSQRKVCDSIVRTT